jgi:hypothetical protein
MALGHLRRLAPALAAAALLPLTGCKPLVNDVTGTSPTPTSEPAATATPLPTPVPSPTPLYVPYKRLDTGHLFNGIQYQVGFSTESGSSAATEVAAPDSYSLHVDLHVRVPHAINTKEGLTTLNPDLPAVFPQLEQWLQAAKVSPLYERLYRHKIASLQLNLQRLDQLLSRHDFFDCQTILEIQPPGSTQKLLLIQSAMDVDSDGSDPDRVPIIDANSQTFQPMTSYKWPKVGMMPNPFADESEAKLDTLTTSLAQATTATQRERIKDAMGSEKYDVRELRTESFLVASADPYIVIPGSVLGQKDDPFSPGIGDYCAVIYGNVIYPAIVGDVGPGNKVGEASLRIAQQLNPMATSENRPVSALKITYLVFPGSAEKPFSPPNLNHWHDRVDALLKGAGGYTGELFAWTDITTPPPTPTPTPAPTETASPSPSASPDVSGSGAVTTVQPTVTGT